MSYGDVKPDLCGFLLLFGQRSNRALEVGSHARERGDERAGLVLVRSSNGREEKNSKCER